MKNFLFLLSLPVLAMGLLMNVSPAKADGGKLQILKFEADWCGPCQQMKPIFNKVAKDQSKVATFRTINVDDQPSVADSYNIKGLPTVIALRDGKEVDRRMGYMNAFALKSFVSKNKSK